MYQYSGVMWWWLVPHHAKSTGKMLLIPWALHNKNLSRFQQHLKSEKWTRSHLRNKYWTCISSWVDFRFLQWAALVLLPHIQSAMVIGHASAALYQDMSPKHPKPATFIGCSKAQNTTDCIFKEHHVLTVAKESSHVKAAKSADRFSALWSYKVISLKYNHSCKIHSTSQLGNLP